MAAVSVTYSFSNATVASATEVNQNFTDLINGISDGTKDLSISALTVAGNFTANGTTNTIGNASADDLIITASLASSIAVKTTATYGIGDATHGLTGIYFGANSQTIRIVPSASMSATWTFTLPVTVPTVDGYHLVSTTGGVSSWTNAIKGIVDGSSATAGNVGEIIGTNITSDSSTGTASTEADITSASIALSAGSWVVCYGGVVRLFNDNAGVVMRIRMTTSGNTAVSNSAFLTYGFPALGTSVYQSCHWQVPVNITTAASGTYKLRYTGKGTAASFSVAFLGADTGQFSEQDNDSYFYAVRVR
jgi:hypothetical protein